MNKSKYFQNKIYLSYIYSQSFARYSDTRHTVGLLRPRIGWQICFLNTYSLPLSLSISQVKLFTITTAAKSDPAAMKLSFISINKKELHIHFNKQQEFQLLLFPSNNSKPLHTKVSATPQRQLHYFLPVKKLLILPMTWNQTGHQISHPWAEGAFVATSPTLPEQAQYCAQSHPK